MVNMKALPSKGLIDRSFRRKNAEKTSPAWRIYEDVSSRTGKTVRIKPSLCFYNPEAVYQALVSNSEVKRWLEFISNHYLPESKDVLLIYPCSTEKPYESSRSYKQLFKTLSRLEEQRNRIHLVTISEPFGLVPEEFYGKTTNWHDWKNDWYDCPGLFEWWCNRFGQTYSKVYADKSIDILASYVAQFLEKAMRTNRYTTVIGFVRTFSSRLEVKHDHTHRRILEKASRMAGGGVELLPPKSFVSKLVRQRGHYAWDMYGVAHPQAQEYLLGRLRRILN